MAKKTLKRKIAGAVVMAVISSTVSYFVSKWLKRKKTSKKKK